MGEQDERQYHIICYVPLSAVETVKQSMFAAGAGEFQGYSHCCWQIQGVGEFVPDNSASPHIGAHNQKSSVDEIKLEMMCCASSLSSTVTAIKSSHPYEVPAFAVFEMVSVDSLS